MVDAIITNPSRGILKRVRGGRDVLYPFLELLTPDIAHIIPSSIGEFVGDTLHGGFQSTASGTSAVAAAISTGAVNGAILLDAGTDNDGRSDLSLGLHCLGQLQAVLLCRMQVSRITDIKFEIGFTDVISGTDAGAVNVLATPSFNAADFVGWVMDTDDAGNATKPQGAGVDSTTAATKIEDAEIVAPVAATYQTYIVALRDNSTAGSTNAKFMQLNADGRLEYESNWMENAVTETQLLTPWVFLQSRTGSSATMLIDTLLCWQRRTTG